MGGLLKKLASLVMGKVVRTILSVIVAIGVGIGVRVFTHEGGVQGGLQSMEKLQQAIPDSVVETLSLAPDEDRPVRCRIGQEERLLRGLDCRQQGGYTAGDGSDAGYSTVTAEEQRAAVAPTLARRQPAPDAKKKE